MLLFKRPFVAISTILFMLSSCQLEDKKLEGPNSAPSSGHDEPAEISDVTASEGLPFFLQYNTENDHFELMRNHDVNPVKEEEIVQALNSKYPEIQIEVERKSHDTLFVKIPESTYLTQSIGITGANFYLIEATYGFTSIDGIHVVNFSFDEGDHALPGPYTRENFKEFFN